MTTRREILIALGAGALVAPLASFAQPKGKPVRVCIFELTTADKYQSMEKPFIDTLRELGWVEGRNIIYDRVFANDDFRRLPALAAALVNRNPHVIYTQSGNAAEAAVAATRIIPIVIGSKGDLLERGWVQSFAHPGGNVTGIANLGSQLGPKRLQLLKQALPKATRVGVLVDPIASATIRELKLIEQAAGSERVTVISARVKQASELEAAFGSLAKSRVDALLTTHAQLYFTERRRLFELAAKHRIPVIAHRSEMTDGGALMSYSSILAEQIRRAAHLADKILKGAKPADIPVELPTRFELVVNQRTAKTLGISIPSEVLLQANRVIE